MIWSNSTIEVPVLSFGRRWSYPGPASPVRDGGRRRVQVVDRVIDLLNELGRVQPGLGISELADMVSLPRSTVHRILQSLMKGGLVQQDRETRKYRLGLGFLVLGSSVLNGLDVREAARPYLKQLFQELGETVFLTVLDGNRAICVEKIETVAKSVRFVVQVGSVTPFHCAAGGKVLLAYLPEEMVDRVLDGYCFERYTPYTITSRDSLDRELAVTRSRGFGVCDQEFETFVRAVAAPVFGKDGCVLASITVIGLIDRFDNQFISRALEMVQTAAGQVSRQLGYLGTHAAGQDRLVRPREA